MDRFTQWYASATNQEQYVYDAAGNRVLRRSTNSTSTTLTVYAFGLEEHVYSGSGTNQSNLYYYFLAGHLIGALDGASGSITSYLTDALGSLLTSFTKGSGAAQVKGEQSYTPYGSSQYNAGSINTARGFTGQYADALTGLDYYNARYYDPVVGVFLSADSVQGNAQGSNPYAYVGGNPETRTDPTGQRAISSCYFISCDQGSPAPNDSCTINNCTVTLSYGHYRQTYSLYDLRDVGIRQKFIQDFYNEFAPGYGNAELGFFDYLSSTHRFDNQGGYWDSVDFQLSKDQLLAAYDFLNHHTTQSSMVSNWLAFMEHPRINDWWIAHNSSINAGDQQARASGLYAKESTTEQLFIDEAVHVINIIQDISNISPIGDLFGPQSPATGLLASMLYPKQYDDGSTTASLLLQGFLSGFGGGTAGVVIGATVGGPVGAVVGGLVGVTIGVGGFLMTL